MDSISLLCLDGSNFPGPYMLFSEAYRCTETGDRCDRKCIVTYSVDRKQSELILTRQCPISSEYSSIHIPINPFWSDSLVEDVLKRIFDSSKTHFLNASENYVFQTAAEIMKSRIERYRPESKSHYYCENSSGKDGFAHLLPIYVAVKNQIVIHVQNLLSKILNLWVIASTAKDICGT